MPTGSDGHAHIDRCAVDNRRIGRTDGTGNERAVDTNMKQLRPQDSNMMGIRNRKCGHIQIAHGVCSKGNSRVTRL